MLAGEEGEVSEAQPWKELKVPHCTQGQTPQEDMAHSLSPEAESQHPRRVVGLPTNKATRTAFDNIKTVSHNYLLACMTPEALAGLHPAAGAGSPGYLRGSARGSSSS